MSFLNSCGGEHILKIIFQRNKIDDKDVNPA